MIDFYTNVCQIVFTFCQLINSTSLYVLVLLTSRELFLLDGDRAKVGQSVQRLACFVGNPERPFLVCIKGQCTYS